MKGKVFEYAKQERLVKSYSINKEHEEFTVVTSISRFTRKFSSSDEFFKYWYEAKTNMILDNALKDLPVPAKNEVVVLPQIFQKENAVADQLVDLLLDNINKVKSNAGYIPQAKAIQSNVSSIISLQKLKLDMFKHMKPKCVK